MLGDKTKSIGGSEGFGKLLAPAALGGLVGVLLGNKSTRKMAGKFGKNALIIGGSAAVGAVLWNKYKQRVKETHQDEPQFGMRTSPIDARTKRLIQAIVFAAKAMGMWMMLNVRPLIIACTSSVLALKQSIGCKRHWHNR